MSVRRGRTARPPRRSAHRPGTITASERRNRRGRQQPTHGAGPSNELASRARPHSVSPPPSGSSSELASSVSPSSTALVGVLGPLQARGQGACAGQRRGTAGGPSAGRPAVAAVRVPGAGG